MKLDPHPASRRRLLQQGLAAAGALAGLPAPPARAQAAAPATLPSAALQADLDLLASIYRTLHPGLLRYQTEPEFDARTAALRQRFGSELPLGLAFRELSRWLATVRCGHSYANFYNQRPAVQQALFSGRDKLPFTFRWLGPRMVATGGALARGSEVLAIDGVPAGQIQRRLLPLVRTDGHNEAKKAALLSPRGRDAWETFDIFYALEFGARDRFACEVLAPGATTSRTVELAAATLAERRAQGPSAGRPEAPPSDDAPPWSLRFDDTGGAAVLTMGGWALYNSRWDWARWLGQRLDEVVSRQSPLLVVDLRENEGGLDCGDPILARCLQRPLAEPGAERRVRYQRVPAAWNGVLDTWDESFRDWGERAQPVAGDGRFLRLVSGAQATRVIEPQGPRFQGRLRVLTSATNSSATFRFASLVRQAGVGELVGETTGGNQRGINGGAFFFVRLPETGLEADLPLIGYFPQGPLPPDAGLAPDRAVVTTPEDIAAGRDPVLQAALRV